jgi:hypothetical protein
LSKCVSTNPSAAIAQNCQGNTTTTKYVVSSGQCL